MERPVRQPVSVHKDRFGRFRVSIPKNEVAEVLGLHNKQPARVSIDMERRAVIFVFEE